MALGAWPASAARVIVLGVMDPVEHPFGPVFGCLVVEVTPCRGVGVACGVDAIACEHECENSRSALDARDLFTVKIGGSRRVPVAACAEYVQTLEVAA